MAAKAASSGGAKRECMQPAQRATDRSRSGRLTSPLPLPALAPARSPRTHLSFPTSPAVFQLIRDLPRFGVGSKVTRVTWPPDSYWTVVDVRPKLVRGVHGVPSTQTLLMAPQSLTLTREASC